MKDFVLDFIRVNKIDTLESFDRRSSDLMFMIRSELEKKDLLYKGDNSPQQN
jgi:hypothetical protein